ncbi:hypothetical protein MBBA_0769 [Methanoculleus bourgensis]|uniref:peroxide stress protein YaaA n=1 Tax=Methanoculleus bourgensis TaxID=83986 RepID=UPI0007BCA51B|nr:hypothetical protein MBBA_0769 [Methanoculleus bourgensis]
MTDLLSYSPTSQTLFVFICSGTKDDESPRTAYYDPNSSILNTLPAVRQNLIDHRQKAYDLVKMLYNSGARLTTNPYNENLVFGPDLGGIKEGKYLPALNEYIGRFYNESGLGPDRFEKIVSSGHHVLIISGLYGIIYPNELIQLYESPLEDIPEIQTLWGDDVLTNIIAEYIKAKNIRFVIDLTGQQEYRNLVDWSAIKELAGSTVFHVHSEHFAGAEGLCFIGKFTRNVLLNMHESDFERVEGLYIKDSCCLSPSVIPPEGWPMEESARIQKMLYGPESSRVEFKPALTGTTIDSPIRLLFNEMKYRVMKNIVAMMNSGGGKILVGVKDDRTIKGIDRERDGLHRTIVRNGKNVEADDLYLQILDQMIVQYIGESALIYIKRHFWTYQKKTILIIQVHPSPFGVSLKISKDSVRLKQGEYWIRGNSGDRRTSPSALEQMHKGPRNVDYKS